MKALMMSESEIMSDEESDDLTTQLFELGLAEGDVGYLYWTRVIAKLKNMRAQAMQVES